MRTYQFAMNALAAVALLLPLPGVTDSDLLERGEYLAHIMDCGGCHTPGILKGEPDHDRYLAGSRIGFHVPGHGVAYPPNLTPDPDTGLAEWSVEDIMRAVRRGERPDGSRVAPPMPWPAYSHLTDEDARALATFIKSLPPVEHETPARAAGVEQATHPYLTVEIPE